MQTEQRRWTEKDGWQTLTPSLGAQPQLVFVFGSTETLSRPFFDEVKAWYPQAHIVNCSTSGEIMAAEAMDQTISITAVHFDKTKVAVAETMVATADESREAGARLAAGLEKEQLVHVLVFADGLSYNGTALTDGLSEALPENVAVTGGFAGDGMNFKRTLVGVNGPPKEKTAIVVGLYGTGLQVGYGSKGGWDVFGPERLITKSKNNILYELDDKLALGLYKEYLGEKAKELPASSLLFPLSLRIKSRVGTEVDVVRSCLGVDEKTQTMSFAGDVPQGLYARLMKANYDRLVEGASDAAKHAAEMIGDTPVEFALLVNCIGRRVVLKGRTFEELEAVKSATGSQAVVAGFYSYGEICPTPTTGKVSMFHNQTMTITVFSEK